MDNLHPENTCVVMGTLQYFMLVAWHQSALVLFDLALKRPDFISTNGGFFLYNNFLSVNKECKQINFIIFYITVHVKHWLNRLPLKNRVSWYSGSNRCWKCSALFLTNGRKMYCYFSFNQCYVYLQHSAKILIFVLFWRSTTAKRFRSLYTNTRST